jgi:hypothetical protein
MKIIALAINTFREAIRDKVLYSLIFFAALMVGLSVILDNLTIGEPTKIIKDFGLASIEIFGVLIAIFVGIGLVYKEMEHKTIYTHSLQTNPSLSIHHREISGPGINPPN